MRDATYAAIQYALDQHDQTDQTTDPERLAYLWNVRIIPGTANRATHGPPSVITVARSAYAPRQRFTMHHELAHVLVQRSGLEDAIKAEVDADDADAHLEAVVNHIASRLVMPERMVKTTLEVFGFSPETVLFVRDAARVSLPAAMRRVAFAAQERPTTVFLVGGNHIMDLASSDPHNTLERYQRLPDVGASLPGADLLALEHWRGRRVLGVVGW